LFLARDPQEHDRSLKGPRHCRASKQLLVFLDIEKYYAKLPTMKEKSMKDLDLKKDISKYKKFTGKAKCLESVPSSYA